MLVLRAVLRRERGGGVPRPEGRLRLRVRVLAAPSKGPAATTASLQLRRGLKAAGRLFHLQRKAEARAAGQAPQEASHQERHMWAQVRQTVLNPEAPLPPGGVPRNPGAGAARPPEVPQPSRGLREEERPQPAEEEEEPPRLMDDEDEEPAEGEQAHPRPGPPPPAPAAAHAGTIAQEGPLGPT